MTPREPVILYIHGFNSSAQSFKARLLRERMRAMGREDEFVCPDLDHRPAHAIQQLENAVASQPGAGVALIGSSLGGYYATWLAEKHGLRAVLVNPAVRPYEFLSACLGPQRNLYTGAEYSFTAQHIDELRALEVERVTPERYLLLVTTGDEVLDYRKATARYRGCRQIVVDGGDHGFTGFEGYADAVLRYCDSLPVPSCKM